MTFLLSDIPPLTEELIAALLPQVSEQRREEALRFHHLFGQYCCLRAYTMLMELMHIASPADMPEMRRNAFGKPFFPNGPAFSISHCKTGILVAVDDAPIGVDIESFRRADEALVRHTMSPDEAETILSSTNPDRTFSALWTQKEALLKQQGTGIQSTEALPRLLKNVPGTVCLETFYTSQNVYSICRSLSTAAAGN